MRARAGDLPGMRLRLPYAIGLALLAGFFAVLFDRVALRYLEVDGAAPAVVVVPAAAPPPLEPPLMPPPVPDLSRSPSLHDEGCAQDDVDPAEAAEAGSWCGGRCDTALQGWKDNRGSKAHELALFECTRRKRCAPPPELDRDSQRHDAWAQALFEDAVMRLREHDTIKACAQLETLGRGVPEGSPWRDKAAILRQHRCAD